MEVTSKIPNLSTRASEDYDLVLLAIDGNQKAFAELMDRYRISVYNTMYKMVSNREDAEDLTIEYEFLKEVSNCALQQKLRDFNETKHQYFNKSRKVKIGRPHQKKKTAAFVNWRTHSA